MTAATDPTLVREAALVAGVCARPVISRVTDLDSGETQLVPISCGATREDRCPSCAERAKRLRIQQCREGWHLETEPEHREPEDDPEDDVARADDEEDDVERRVRSTRRRQDAPDLPRVPVEDRTIGRVFTAPDGRTFRPSMFITLTLPSYGPVTSEGVPRNPATYDYRRAALDALHFAKLVDRFVQNTRRSAGYKVQYFATVEAQRRLAPHLHAAVRGAIPRKLVREIRAATYHQVWWPPHDTPTYDGGRLPVWADHSGYVDPDSGAPLPTWDEALDALDNDPDATPAHVLRFGKQDDIKGLIAGTPATDRTIGYLCKYLTKSIAGTHDIDEEPSPAREAHIDRLAEEVRWLPCSPGCSNWLRYGVQPKGARAGMVPGHCTGKAHDRANLGLGGRRVLVSRQWSGKTLAGHKADRAAVVRAALEEAGIDPDDHDELAVSGTDGQWSWEVIPRSRVDDRTYAAAIASAITTRTRWRTEYDAAKAARAAPPGHDVARPVSDVDCCEQLEEHGGRQSAGHRPEARLEQQCHEDEGRLCRVADGDIEDVTEAWQSGASPPRPRDSTEDAHGRHEEGADEHRDSAKVGDALKDPAHRPSIPPPVEPPRVGRPDVSPAERGYAAHPVPPGRAEFDGTRSTRRVRQFGSSASE